jgi:fatty acid desaturase 2 (delta-6 desaturase)
VETRLTVLEKHAALTKDFQKLHDELESEGLFKPSPFHILIRFLELGVFFVFGVWLQLSGYRVSSAMVMAFLAGRSGYLMHEAGHNSLTGKPKFDRFLHSFLFGSDFVNFVNIWG